MGTWFREEKASERQSWNELKNQTQVWWFVLCLSITVPTIWQHRPQCEKNSNCQKNLLVGIRYNSVAFLVNVGKGGDAQESPHFDLLLQCFFKIIILIPDSSLSYKKSYRKSLIKIVLSSRKVFNTFDFWSKDTIN